jgi:hypothetical protein
MNKNQIKSWAALMAAGCLTLTAFTVLAQESDTNSQTAAVPAQTDVSAPLQSDVSAGQTIVSAAAPAAATQLGYGATQILQLARARVGDDTIITYIRNSGNGYNLNADQIIYLRQQGVSSAVVNTMLSQPAAAGLPPMPATPAPAPVSDSQSSYASAPAARPSIVGPAVSAIDPTAAAAAATTYYYYPPYYYPYYGYSYPAYGGYGWYPGVSVSLGWRGGWGGGWHGGFHGGWHR